jgi:dihydroorotate dehydrogenase electron transfer subunit
VAWYTSNALIRRHLAPILATDALAAPGHFVLTLDAPDLARDSRPGSFVAALAETGGERLLRKPFSVFTVDREKGIAQILFSVYGPTTKAMSQLRPGETLDILGPLGGRLFAPDTRPGVRHILVGGGYGVPPLNFLARELKQADPGAEVTLIHGARSANLLVGDDGLRERGIEVIACTDDGSKGVSGKVTDALSPLLADGVAVYTCGPTPMMKAVALLSLERAVPCQVSMETFMPCGVGICVGCALALPDGTYARACTDGPVFFANEVAW